MLAALYDFLYDFLSNLTAGLVLALGGMVVKKLCNKNKKTTHDKTQPLDQ